MAYIKTEWVDGENKYSITDQAGNIIPGFENIKLLYAGIGGTPLSQEKMNKIEQGIAYAEKWEKFDGIDPLITEYPENKLWERVDLRAKSGDRCFRCYNNGRKIQLNPFSQGNDTSTWVRDGAIYQGNKVIYEAGVQHVPLGFSAPIGSACTVDWGASAITISHPGGNEYWGGRIHTLSPIELDKYTKLRVTWEGYGPAVSGFGEMAIRSNLLLIDSESTLNDNYDLAYSQKAAPFALTTTDLAIQAVTAGDWYLAIGLFHGNNYDFGAGSVVITKIELVI